MHQKGYLCLDRSLGKIIMNRHVVFNESCFPFVELSSNSSKSYEPSAIIFVPTTFPISCLSPDFVSLSYYIYSLPISINQNDSSILSNLFNSPFTIPCDNSKSLEELFLPLKMTCWFCLTLNSLILILNYYTNNSLCICQLSSFLLLKSLIPIT